MFIFSRRFERYSFDIHEETFVENLSETCITLKHFRNTIASIETFIFTQKNISASPENFKSQKKSKNYQFWSHFHALTQKFFNELKTYFFLFLLSRTEFNYFQIFSNNFFDIASKNWIKKFNIDEQIQSLVQNLLFGFNISPNRQFDGKIFIFSRWFEGYSFDFHEEMFVENLVETCVTLKHFWNTIASI